MRVDHIVGVTAMILTLTACAHAPREPEIRTVEVKVPVAAQCVPPSLPAAPVYPDTREALQAAGAPPERYQLLAAGRELRIVRLRDLEAVVASCLTVN